MITTLASVAVGAVLGSLLTFVSSYLLGRQEHSWQADRARFERELLIVKSLDEALVEIELHTLNRGVPEGESPVGAAQAAWERAWFRMSPFLINLDLKGRYEAVGRILSELVMYDGDARPGRRKTLVLRATLSARQGIAFFGREEQLPPRCFPLPDELTRLLEEGDPDPLLPGAPLHEWLTDNPVPSWHPEKET